MYASLFRQKHAVKNKHTRKKQAENKYVYERAMHLLLRHEEWLVGDAPFT